MYRLINIASEADIPIQFRNTPVGNLFRFHNLQHEINTTYSKAELLIGMCMDNRKQLRIPENFAFIIRTGGANLRYSEFKVSYAIGVGKVNYIALIGHNHCGMVNIFERKESFICGLVENAGWEYEKAEEHFNTFAPMFEIGNEIDFLLSETKRLRDRYPKINIAPLMYLLEDNKLYFVNEE
ncbi:MAG: carbonic anhydrase [Bacteroidales bacterium]|nr:carbonic anhydrase [Bacteroidales bacterium]MBN2819166.1 carbonic anhydrase [Bacteroidales bacterium]